MLTEVVNLLLELHFLVFCTPVYIHLASLQRNMIVVKILQKLLLHLECLLPNSEVLLCKPNLLKYRSDFEQVSVKQVALYSTVFEHRAELLYCSVLILPFAGYCIAIY